MTNDQIPKAWLPAHNFTLEGESKYEKLLTDLCEVGQPFIFKCWDWDGYTYLHSVNTAITPSTSPQGSAHIELRVTKKYQSRSDVEALENRGYKRALPTSSVWTRVMLGKPAPAVLANHALAGIKFGAAFKPNMGFTVQAESIEFQEDFDQILKEHNVWSMPSTGDLWFLNV